MCAIMYRHRPALPAIIAACIVFIVGMIIVAYLRPQMEAGEIDESPILMVGCATCVLSGALLIIAFSRYRFTHLWKNTGAVHSDKYKKPRKKNRRRNSSNEPVESDGRAKRNR